MEKEHTIKERPQKNMSCAATTKGGGGGALKRRPGLPFVVSYSGCLSLIVCSFSILGGSHFKFLFLNLELFHFPFSGLSLFLLFLILEPPCKGVRTLKKYFFL